MDGVKRRLAYLQSNSRTGNESRLWHPATNVHFTTIVNHLITPLCGVTVLCVRWVRASVAYCCLRIDTLNYAFKQLGSPCPRVVMLRDRSNDCNPLAGFCARMEQCFSILCVDQTMCALERSMFTVVTTCSLLSHVLSLFHTHTHTH